MIRVTGSYSILHFAFTIWELQPVFRQFPPLRCFARPIMQSPSVAASLWVSLPSVLSSVSKNAWIEYRWPAWPLKTITFLCLEKLVGCFHSMFCVINHLCCEALSHQFCSVCLIPSRYGSEFFLLFLSAVASLMNTSDPVPLAAEHAHVITLPPPC